MLVSLTVGKVDAGVAVLLTEDKRLIEFPSILLPPTITSGSIVDITVARNHQAEQKANAAFSSLQTRILDTYGLQSPATPELRLRNATQTSLVLEWDPIQLATSTLRSLALYRNGNKAGNIPKPLEQLATKISGLAVDTEYSFYLVLKTTGGTYTSNTLNVKTQKMTDLTGIVVTPGVLPQPLRENLDSAVDRIGAKIVDKLRIDTTHFVCTEGRGADWERAVEMNIPVVRPEWIEGCEREGKIVGVRGYYLNANPKDRQVGSNPAFAGSQQSPAQNAARQGSQSSLPSRPISKQADTPVRPSQDDGPGPELPPTPPAKKELPPVPPTEEESEEEEEEDERVEDGREESRSPVSPASEEGEPPQIRQKATVEDEQTEGSGDMDEVPLVPSRCLGLLHTTSSDSGNLTTLKCSTTKLNGSAGPGYNDCRLNLTAYDQATDGGDATSRCYNVYDCLYSGLLPNEQASHASAQVVLGLTPTLLATVAPSLGEVSMLSSQRPLLSFLLSLGGPAVLVPRLLGYTNPLKSLKPTPSFFGPDRRDLTSLASKSISSLEYVAAAGAIANVIYLSWQLGSRTVIAWKCNSTYLPFVWSTLPAAIHLVAATAWHYSQNMRQVRRELKHNENPTEMSLPLIGTISWLPRWLHNEFTLTANCARRNYASQPGKPAGEKRSERPINSGIVVFLMEAAELMAFVHIVFGTAVFSSLNFISTLDALTVIIRYVVSGCICRFVLKYELHNMMLVETETGSEHELHKVTTSLTHNIE